MEVVIQLIQTNTTREDTASGCSRRPFIHMWITNSRLQFARLFVMYTSDSCTVKNLLKRFTIQQNMILFVSIMLVV